MSASRPERRGPRTWAAGAGLVLARELGAFFETALAYVYLTAGLALLGSLFMNEFFLAGRLDLAPLFELLPPLAVFLLPAITMRLWAEDRKTRVFELWMTLPLSPGQVVAGKYLAALALFAVFLAGTLPAVVMLLALGDPDLGLVLAGYAGALMLGGLFLAAGLFLSALTSDQVTAFVLGVAACFLFVFTGHPRVVAVLDGMAPGAGTFLAEHVAALPRYERCAGGVIELSALVYFGGLAAAFLWLNALAVRQGRT